MNQSSNPLRAILKVLPFVGPTRPLATVIVLNGVIGGAGPGRRGLTLAQVESAIEAAFKPGGLKAVALSINSPGGSPVQSRLIFAAIRREAAKKQTPVYAFIEDVGASGGYILALAGDEIYADESSVVGSIGVIAAGFGFQEAMTRFGVERRVHTAGESKSQLDPFRPEDPEDVARLEDLLETLHRQFIDMVKARRAGKLGDQEDIFTGAFWAAPGAEARGLIDGTGRLTDFLRARLGDDVRIKKVEPKKGSILKRLMSGQLQATPQALVDPDAVIGALEARALWARYGR